MTQVTDIVKRPEQPMVVQAQLTSHDVIAQVRLIQEVMQSVMQKDQHYGVIPGCGSKPTLLKPGAEKLALTFRLAPSFDTQVVDLSNGQREYRVTCTLRHILSGDIVGQGVGSCSTLESKYRYRQGERKCPNCGKATIIKGKQEYGGGWICFAKKGGCGQKWPDGAKEIEDQQVGRVDNPDIADTYNTVWKMAKKRAQVDATLTATAASDIFTQDIEDFAPAPPAPEPSQEDGDPFGDKSSSKTGSTQSRGDTRVDELREHLGNALTRKDAEDFRDERVIEDAQTGEVKPVEPSPAEQAAIRKSEELRSQYEDAANKCGKIADVMQLVEAIQGEKDLQEADKHSLGLTIRARIQQLKGTTKKGKAA